MKASSLRASSAHAFRVACQRSGIATPARCGPTVRGLLLELRCQPLAVLLAAGCTRSVKMPQHARLGVAIKAGLARFVPADKHYVITPAGETWLTELEIHGLLEDKADSGKQKMETGGVA